MFLILGRCVSQCKEVVSIGIGRGVTGKHRGSVKYETCTRYVIHTFVGYLLIVLIRYTSMTLFSQQIMSGEIASVYINVLR